MKKKCSDLQRSFTQEMESINKKIRDMRQESSLEAKKMRGEWSEKNQILESKKQSLLPKAQEKLDEAISYLKEAVESRITGLNTQDISKLTELEKQLEQRIHGSCCAV